MKKLLLTALLMVFVSTNLFAQFDKYFHDKTLRYDFYHAGDEKNEYFFLDKLIEEPYWGGSKTNLLDKVDYGYHMLRVFDAETNKEIYSRGFCTLFNEWQHTPAAKTTQIAQPSGVVMPYPKQKARIELYTRNDSNVFEKKYEHTFDPNHFMIEKPSYTEDVFEVLYSGKPENKVDIVLLGEGYSESERALFEKDCIAFRDAIFSFSPYKERMGDFNVRGVWVPSKEQGVTIPGDGIWKNSKFETKFYTFESERYQMTDNLQLVLDEAGNAPYDLIYILSNTQKYGGGGIYNSYGVSSAHNEKSTAKIHVHEFGHLFVGLGDEYGYGGESLSMFGSSFEPWEVNITSRADFDKKKIWKSLLDPKTPVPTKISKKGDNPVGLYEGAGYFEKGMYRPSPVCLMRHFAETDDFCPVCTAATIEMIDFYTK